MQAGISQAKLHRLSGVARDVISSAENGGEHTPEILYRLANSLNEHFFDHKYKTINADTEIEE